MSRPQTSEAPSSQPQLLSDQVQAQSSLHVQSKVQRQKSVSRRMLSRVKQGIASKSKSSQSVRATGSETGLVRRLSGRRKPSSDAERRSHSFELSRDSIESTIEEVSGVSGVSTDTPPPVQRSFTDSTVSTSEVLEDLASIQIPPHSGDAFGTYIGQPFLANNSSPTPELETPSPQPTPRPLRQPLGSVAGSRSKVSVAVPCVDLTVTVDSTSVDVHSKRDIWVTIDALVGLKTGELTSDWIGSAVEEHLGANYPPVDFSPPRMNELETRNQQYPCGTITNLRLCYKPGDGCRIRNIIGQKSYRDLAVGQQCTLFIKLGVPRMQKSDDSVEPDQESLLAEIESMIGTLETDVLHVEARYRHSLFPSDNVVALKHTCKVLRPKTDSRWSIIEFYEKDDSSSSVHALLAQYLAAHYAADEALDLLHRYFDYDTRARPGLAEICSMLQNKINVQRNGLDDQQPEVVVTDTNLPRDGGDGTVPEHFDTAPSTPGESKARTSDKPTDGPSLLRSSTLGPPRISAPRTTKAIASSTPIGANSHESHDSAQQLWRHIRRTSLSTRQLEEMTPDRVSSLEAGDDSLKELRRRAIANKRSIGAETLRIWKWEEDMQAKEKPAEAPWM